MSISMKNSIQRITYFYWTPWIVLVLLCIVFSHPAWAQYATDIKINTDGTAHDQFLAECSPSIAVHQGSVYTTWADTRSHVDGKADIYFAKGTVDADGNVAFGQNVKVNDVANSAGDDWSSYPSITVNQDGDIFVVWTDNRNSENQKNNEDIYVARSIDGGETFEANLQIDIIDSVGERAPKVAAAGSYVYVIYGGSSHLYIAVSNDKGATFSAPHEVTGGIADNAVLAAAGDNVYLAQASDSGVQANYDDIFFAKSSDHGTSFSDFEVINEDGGGTRQADVTIAASGEHVYLLWRDSRDSWSMYMAKSHDGGNSFGANILMSDTANTPKPSVSAYNDHVAISYTNIYDREWSIVSRVSHDAGESWTEETLVSELMDRSSIGPSSIAINDQIVGVLWEGKDTYTSNDLYGFNIYGDGFRFADGSTEPVPITCPADTPTVTVQEEAYILTLPEFCYDGVTYPSSIKLILNTNGTWSIE